MDAAWNDSELARETWRTVVYGGRPAKVSTDDERRAVVVTHLRDGQILAEAALPGREPVSLYPASAYAVDDGIELLIRATPKDDASGSQTYWLVRFGPRGRAMPAIPYPLPSSDFVELIAVGEHRIATVRIDTRDQSLEDSRPERSHVIILDGGGSVVRSFIEDNVGTVFPVVRTAFAVTSRVADRDMVRVFDLRRLVWAGPARPSGRQVDDAIIVGDRAVLVGKDVSRPEPWPVEVASLTHDGTLSPWRPVGLVGDIVLFPSHDRASALLVGHPQESRAAAVRILAIGSDLKIARSPRDLPPALFLWGIAVSDAIYGHAWSRAIRFACTP